jgi:hypothetical protein
MKNLFAHDSRRFQKMSILRASPGFVLGLA